ncbi:MAG: 16S rRNA (cytosine(967)-C(5))-methyltransferase RsmB [Vicinamibacterales bacterium]|jgi:16S rRNA (cytosine967-C5)-methyltransferase|nr:16S rRNA (cytosine(967)-C(5))-methyltransferase RsmB [Vicinamibacterales bacterium]
MTPARLAAYRVLQAVSGGDDLPQALARIRDTLTDDRDRALVTEIATGTLRWLGALDRVIEQAAARPRQRLDAEVLTVLRLGAYQLLYLERVPAAAAVNESVTLARRVGKSSASGLVNAVLRGIASTAQSPPLPPEPGPSAPPEAQLAYLSVTCSHPRWLVERWLARLGFRRTVEWVRFNNTPPRLTLRANRLRTTPSSLARQLAEHGVRTVPTRFAGDGLRVEAGNPLRTPLADRGLFLVQDEGSQLVAEMTAARPGERILDSCAAPGGKAIAIAAAVGQTGRLVASDLRPARVALLRRTLEQYGAAGVHIVRLDLCHPAPFGPIFDCVLVDAPCSGLGVVRRDPEIRWRRHKPDLAKFARVQRAMLAHASRTVRPDGRLVYATCSSEPEENEEVVSAFLADHPDFGPVHPDQLVPSLSQGLRDTVDDDGRLSTMPDLHGLEAFFAAILRRSSTPRCDAPADL